MPKFMKKVIRITESELKKIITESAKKIIKENNELDNYYEYEDYAEYEPAIVKMDENFNTSVDAEYGTQTDDFEQAKQEYLKFLEIAPTLPYNCYVCIHKYSAVDYDEETGEYYELAWADDLFPKEFKNV